MLFGQDGADEADQSVAVGEDADDVGASADLFVESLLGVVRPDLAPDLLGERGERQQIRPRRFEVIGDKTELVLRPLEALAEPTSLKALRHAVKARMPRVDLPEILLEIAARTGCMEAFTHLTERTARAADLTTSLCAVLLAEAARRVRAKGFEIGNIDSTIVAQAPKLAPHIEKMRERIAQARKCGYAVLLDVVVERMGGIGVAILDTQGRPVAALSIASLNERILTREAALAHALVREATVCQVRWAEAMRPDRRTPSHYQEKN